MFTLEESALLSRMLRVVAWMVVCVVVGVGGYILFRWETRGAVASHPMAISAGHHHS
jgi:hypothetical protein